jgi:parallel beta-helix repeat protein
LIASLLGAACGGGSGTDAPVEANTAVDAATVDHDDTVDTSAGDPIDVDVGVAPAEGEAPAPADAGDNLAMDDNERAYALGSTPSTCETVPPMVSPTVQRRVTDFGAVPDDGRDDTAAIQRALDGVNSGEMLVFPTGRYHISKWVRVRKPGITIRGASGAIIHGTNPDSMAILIEADRTTVQTLTFTAITDRRRTAAQHARIAVAAGNSDGSWRWVYDTVIRDNKILPSGAPGTPGANSASNVGILMVRADRFLIANNTVSRTLADGIHVTNGSRNGRILNNIVRETGDDMIAVVSYIDGGNPALNKASDVLGDWLTRLDTRVNKNILIAGNRVGGQYWGRGISVVGGRTVTIARNTIDNVPYGAGILLAREANYQTFGTRNVLVEYNTIRNVQNMAPPYDPLGRALQRTGHGAVEIHASQFLDETANTTLREELTVADVLIRANTVERANANAVRMGVGGSRTLSATDSTGRLVTRTYESAALPSPSIQIGRFNSVSREPVSVHSDDLQARGVHCSGNLRDGTTYQPSVCRTTAPAVTGATLRCGSDGKQQL